MFIGSQSFSLSLFALRILPSIPKSDMNHVWKLNTLQKKATKIQHFFTNLIIDSINLKLFFDSLGIIGAAFD